MLSLVQPFIYNTTRTYYLHSNELKYFFSYNNATVWHNFERYLLYTSYL